MRTSAGTKKEIIPVCTYIYNTHIHARAHTHTHTQKHTNTHTQIYRYMYIYIYHHAGIVIPIIQMILYTSFVYTLIHVVRMIKYADSRSTCVSVCIFSEAGRV